MELVRILIMTYSECIGCHNFDVVAFIHCRFESIYDVIRIVCKECRRRRSVYTSSYWTHLRRRTSRVQRMSLAVVAFVHRRIGSIYDVGRVVRREYRRRRSVYTSSFLNTFTTSDEPLAESVAEVVAFIHRRIENIYDVERIVCRECRRCRRRS